MSIFPTSSDKIEARSPRAEEEGQGMTDTPLGKTSAGNDAYQTQDGVEIRAPQDMTPREEALATGGVERWAAIDTFIFMTVLRTAIGLMIAGVVIVAGRILEAVLRFLLMLII
ncbi:MAG: hypothetical protein HWE26_17005 [Alteromonadaceae bacterium]|nr:hypothetical protein [Alteromonadaceae bacterium]